MKKDEFVKAAKAMVEVYLNNPDTFKGDAQLRVNPELLTVDMETEGEFQSDLEDSDEAIEDAAYAQGDETEAASDYQAAQNPDFYPAKTLVKDGKPDVEVIERLAQNYF